MAGGKQGKWRIDQVSQRERVSKPGMNAHQIQEDKLENFNPNNLGYKGNLFGLPFTPETAQLVIVPVPWEVTVTYHSGAASGPAAILDASIQVDLFFRNAPDAWKLGVSMLPVNNDLLAESEKLRDLASRHVNRLENHGTVAANDPLLVKINEACETLNVFVKSTTQRLLKSGKMVGLLGGDHSTPLGFLRALSEVYARFGILHIDAHADLRKSYQGFTYSHASIMHNALKLPSMLRLVQVGIRDLCEEEMQVTEKANGKIVSFFDEDIKSEMYAGRTWDNICDKIIAALPDFVYISFDIDGLDPKLCPNTGTPVPGGLEFDQAVYLLKKVVKSGKKIIGFDLNEVAPGKDNDWDANVGARMLYQLCSWMAISRGKLVAEY
jgi:agmatinase